MSGADGVEPAGAGAGARGQGGRLIKGARGRWARVAGLVLVVAVAGLLARAAYDNFGALGRVHVALHAGWLVLAVPCSLASGLLLALGWRSMLAAWGAVIGRAVAVRVWWRAQAGRYLPTGAFQVVSREVLAGRAGVARSLGATSNVIELGVLLAWGAVVTGVFLPSRLLPVPARVLVGLAGAAVVVALPWGMRLASAAAPRVVPRLMARAPALAGMGRSPAALYRSAGLYGVSTAAKTAAFVLMAAGMVTVHPGDAFLLAGAVQGASIVGVLSISPAGIGVREAMFVVLLESRFGAGDALVLAVAWRAWELAWELVWLAVGAVGAGVARSVRRTAAH
ncbi:MAG: lysylphosphatidylglycerol synthase domain-containing protein [Acidimicrobiales bacterium]